MHFTSLIHYKIMASANSMRSIVTSLMLLMLHLIYYIENLDISLGTESWFLNSKHVQIKIYPDSRSKGPITMG